MAPPQPHGPAIPPISSHRGSRHRRHLAFLAVVALLAAVVAVGVAYTATASSAALDTRVLEAQCRGLVTAQLGNPKGITWPVIMGTNSGSATYVISGQVSAPGRGTQHWSCSGTWQQGWTHVGATIG